MADTLELKKALLLAIGVPLGLCVVGAALAAGGWFGLFNTVIGGNWTAFVLGACFFVTGVYLLVVFASRIKELIREASR